MEVFIITWEGYTSNRNIINLLVCNLKDKKEANDYLALNFFKLGLDLSLLVEEGNVRNQ